MFCLGFVHDLHVTYQRGSGGAQMPQVVHDVITGVWGDVIVHAAAWTNQLAGERGFGMKGII